MTKDELRAELMKGRQLDEILHFKKGQDCWIFKADEFQDGDDVLYIPDVDLNYLPVDRDLREDELSLMELLSCCYTGKDFIEDCDGDEVLAERLFWYCDWQHPSSALPELEDEYE